MYCPYVTLVFFCGKVCAMKFNREGCFTSYYFSLWDSLNYRVFIAIDRNYYLLCLNIQCVIIQREHFKINQKNLLNLDLRRLKISNTCKIHVELEKVFKVLYFRVILSIRAEIKAI